MEYHSIKSEGPSSFCASCTSSFKYIPLSVVQLDWSLVCRQKGLNNEKSFVWACGEAFVFLFSLNWLAKSPCIVVEFSHSLSDFCNYGEHSSSLSCIFIHF